MAYEKIPYASFMWKFGTTSFRTTEFNYMTEKQLGLLKKFWKYLRMQIKVGRKNT